MCFERRKSETKDRLRHIKRTHRNSKHPDIPWKDFLVRPFIPVVDARKDIPLETGGWECPFCKARLRKQKVRARQLAVDNHHRTVHPRIAAKRWLAKMVSVRFKGKKKSAACSRKHSDNSAVVRNKKLATHKVVKVPAKSPKAASFRLGFEYWCVDCLTKVGGYGGGVVGFVMKN